MVTYRKAFPEEMPEILDFINMVFSMAHRPHDFRQLVPKLYQEGNEEKSTHYVAVEEGKIKAVVCMLPVTLCHKNSSITCGTIGSVSVHPYSRQKGYMRQLMKLAVSDMEETGISMSSLSGRRHRYQYYGYELGGFYYQYRFTPDNFRHWGKHVPAYRLRLEKIQDANSPFLGKIQELSKTHTVFAQRNPEDFFLISQSWGSQLYAVLEEETFQGYVSLNQNQVQELLLRDESLIFPCLCRCLEKAGGQELLLRAYPHQLSLMNALSPFYESCTMHIDDNYQIFDCQKVLRFFLDVKADCCSLEDGSLNISVQGYGNYRISVENQKPAVTCSDQPGDVTLTPLELISCMFSPDPGAQSRLLPKTYNWFPLPLALCPLDKC